MNTNKEHAVHAMLNMLNMLARDHGVHISAANEMYVKVDDQVVALMEYNATEKAYMVREVTGQGNEETQEEA